MLAPYFEGLLTSDDGHQLPERVLRFHRAEHPRVFGLRAVVAHEEHFALLELYGKADTFLKRQSASR